MMAANRFDGLVAEWEPRLRKAFLDGVYRLRDRAQVEQITRMLERGDFEAAIRAVHLDPASFREFERSIVSAYQAGGDYVTDRLPSAPAGRLGVEIGLFSRNPVAENIIRETAATLVRDIVSDQRVGLRNFLVAGLEEGNNPRTTALDLVGRISPTTGRREGGIIGLTSSQEGWVRNYEAELRDHARLKDALTRALRDKRFDPSISRAIRNGEPIPPTTINSMVRSYRNRALRYRAEAIARTETIRALNTAQGDAIQQAIESGKISADQVTFIWRATHDKRTRDTHRGMDGQTIRHGELFQSPSGARLQYPGDPAAPAAEVINCRCWMETRVDFLKGIR